MWSFLKLLVLIILPHIAIAQSANILGAIENDRQEAIPYANVILFGAADSTMVKTGISDEEGNYELKDIDKGNYFLEISSLGYERVVLNDIILLENQILEVEKQYLKPSLEQLQEVTVTASRPMIQVKPDRTTFNIEGTINSVGSDGISLLGKAPGISVDNNNNISILGRTGVLVYVNGKRVPLRGEELGNYLENLLSEQISSIDIITNPGVRYDAEGNAGIIDIKLKRDKNLGTNGTINTSYTQGKYASNSINGSGNFRNKRLNIYAAVGASKRKGFNESTYENYQNGLLIVEKNNFVSTQENYNYQFGTDFFATDKHTFGVLINGISRNGNQITPSMTEISNQLTPNQVDSTLVVNGNIDTERTQQTYNLYYRFSGDEGSSLDFNIDNGNYDNRLNRFQPNQFFDSNDIQLSQEINSITAPTDIDIYTLKADYETNLWGGKLGLGSKLSRIVTDNIYLFFNEANGNKTQNNQRSRLFNYKENVYAGYVNYSIQLKEELNVSAGLRTEQTSSNGDLQAFSAELEEPSVDLDYFDWFPNIGITWDADLNNKLSINYGRRINRPDFNVLNPFNDQINLLSSEMGNPFLRPEIQNSFDLGYSYKSIYNFKIAYSKTEDKITRLVGPDANEPRATFSTWENLGFQNTFSFNSNIVLSMHNWLKTYFNLSGSYIDNQANFGEEAIIDLQVFSYKLYIQNSIIVSKNFTAEVSGYYNGPTVWGGTFEMEPNWKLDVGLQHKFLKDKLSARITATDVFYKSNWRGKADFNGLRYFGTGFRDSRKVSINLSYNFGNQNLKRNNREKGLENEGERVGG